MGQPGQPTHRSDADPEPADETARPPVRSRRTEGILRPVDYSRRTAYRPPPQLYRGLQAVGPVVTRWGLAPDGVVTLEVPGRRSGLTRRSTVIAASHAGHRYLVALAGESDWVRNSRASGGRVVLVRRQRRTATLVEVPVGERPPIIRDYLLRWGRRPGSRAVVSEARHYFGVSGDPTEAELAAIAGYYPVFRINVERGAAPRPRLMRAAVRARYGPPDVVRIADVPMPVVGDHDLLVRIHASTVNRTDCGFRSGTPFIVRFFAGLPGPRDAVLGGEFAGVVQAVGPAVTSFVPGQRVFGYSEGRFGAHAEYLAMPDDGPIAAMPAGRTFEEVAPATEGSHYAWSMIKAAKVRDGQQVLVNGATGAIGSAGVQLLKLLGATVTAVCDSDHLDLVKTLGADRVIDRNLVDFTTDSHTYDVVFDAVGKSSFGRCKPLLRPGGIYLSTDLGPWSQNPVLGLVTPLLRGRKVLFPIPPKHEQAGVRYLCGLIESGAFTPVIDRRYPLEEIVQAYAYVESGQKIGNVLLTLDPTD
jgi:NADPH:quinone reductase-like Zn-dependent oxidoreductase